MLVEQLVTSVATGTVKVQGLSPNLDEALMYHLMNLAPSCSDLEDHHLPAYIYAKSADGRPVFGRAYFKGISTAQTNFIIGQADHLQTFRNNPALFTFISCAEGLLHNKSPECPSLPMIDYGDGRSRFDPVFEIAEVEELANKTIQEVESCGSVAVLGIPHPFRFLIPLFGLIGEDERLDMTFSVNSSYLPKDETINLFVFPTISNTLIQHLEENEIRALTIRDVMNV